MNKYKFEKMLKKYLKESSKNFKHLKDRKDKKQGVKKYGEK